MVNKRSGESTAIIQLLESVHMMETVTKPKPFVASVVYEFYANLSPRFLLKCPMYIQKCMLGDIFMISMQTLSMNILGLSYMILMMLSFCLIH